ncbi:MAG: hypothetical protein ACON4H_04270 [Rubripirellula sp.]
MARLHATRWIILFGFVMGLVTTGNAEPTDSPASYLLRYKVQPGEQLHYEVTHAAKTKTRIQGEEEISQVHTTTQRHWNVIESEKNTFKFEHILDAVAMTQQQGQQSELRWDSQKDPEPPKVFGRIAEQIGHPLSTITASEAGKELEREADSGTKTSLGMGSLTLSFPEEPVKIGESWSTPHEVRARTDNGSVKIIKIRQLYTLEKVQTGVAFLRVRSQPLTPINEESVRAQVVQQLSNGIIRFDIDNGHMLSKQLDWDETVIGFQGANSLMEYRARFTERLVDNSVPSLKR